MISRLAKRAGRRAAGGREVGFRSVFILFMSCNFFRANQVFRLQPDCHSLFRSLEIEQKIVVSLRD
jgi:hypothetical protein